MHEQGAGAELLPRKFIWTRLRKSLTYAAAKTLPLLQAGFQPRKKFAPMTRFLLAIVAATAFSGCQHSGQQVIDPFWGHTTVAPPATGSIGAPIVCQGSPQPLQQPVITPGTPLSSGGPQATTPPNLLPPPMSPTPAAPAAVAPTPAMPGAAGSAVPGYGASATPSPPTGNPLPGRAPPSGYSNPDLPPAGSPAPPPAGSPTSPPATPPATPPGSAPADRYPFS